jgi:hypothetical protein
MRKSIGQAQFEYIKKIGQNQYLFSTIVVRIDSGVLGAKPQIATL